MKSHILSILFCGILFLNLFSSCDSASKEVSLETLLDQMVDRELPSKFPKPYFTVKQYSSYDQNSISPDQEGWFANHDASWFIRQEENQGRREFVMLDADGPGAVARFWMTFGNEDAYTGTIRFYFDGNDLPEIEGPVLDIISGGALVGEPLSSSVSPETNYFQRGHNLYLPIPYSNHLKITYECPALEPDKHRPSVYYNINYRTYENNTPVKSFTRSQLTELKDQIDQVQELLNQPAQKSLEEDILQVAGSIGKLAAGETFKLDLKGQSAIQKIEIKLEASNLEQALRSTVLEIVFDGEKTVWAPLGDFFGTGYQIRPYRTWYSEVQEDGKLSCYWLMPFKEAAQISIVNYGDQDINLLENNYWTKKTRWTSSSMHFGAIWQELREVETGGSSGVNGDDKHFDVNYVTLQGEGVYMGTGLTVFNTVDAWWGEGDEKIWVDGEAFPSFIGTGTEDYFGYAWCRPEKFSHFLIAQPDGSGNFHAGMSVNLRFNLLDAIPFKESLQFDLELWHWAKTVMNYAPLSFWYLKPGGSCNIEPNPEAVQLPVSLNKSDLIKPQLVENGILEGENIRVIEVSHGDYQNQAIRQWNWSNNAQLWWIADSPNAQLTGDFLMPESGAYQVELVFSKAIDYGNFQIGINGSFNPKTFVGYHDQTGQEVVTQKVKLGIFNLNDGSNTVSIKSVGTHPAATPRYMVGIDYLKFTRVNKN